MDEMLLQHLWRYSLINPAGLKTNTGEAVTVIHPGTKNTDAGPDFLEAKIRIGAAIWVGNVELHVKSSDWYKHRHQDDMNYRNIILHVVYESDTATAGLPFPELALKKHIKQELLDRYASLMHNNNVILCKNALHRVPDIIWSNWLERLLAERWEQKAALWSPLWEQATHDWSILLYYRMAANFGFRINSDAFLQLAQSLPLTILARHRASLLQAEALLFGQAGFLKKEKCKDLYSVQLLAEYEFLQQKYQLHPIPVHLWKFMRLRPANFPTVRIAQFAALVHASESLFNKILKAKNIGELLPLLEAAAGTYWNTHYRFNETAHDDCVKRLGDDALMNIIINTVAPVQFFYAKQTGDQALYESSLKLLQSVPAENNRIIREWNNAGVCPDNAAQTQSLIQLYNEYCSRKNCLNCTAGSYLVRY